MPMTSAACGFSPKWTTATHGELWTPVVVSDDVILELVMPTESRHDYSL